MDHYEEVVRDASCTLYTYGLERGADFTGSGLHYASDHQFVGVEFDMDGALSGRVRVGMPGRFNADNALAALSVCSLALGEEGHDKKLLRALENVRVDGRMEIAHVSERCSVIVDYAHNAMSMESLFIHPPGLQPEAAGMRLWLRWEPGKGAAVLHGRDRRKNGGSLYPHRRQPEV